MIDEGRRTYLRDRLGWTGLVVEPTARELPSPDRHWRLSTAGTRTVAGARRRSSWPPAPTASRRSGMVVDDATGLLLAREVLGPQRQGRALGAVLEHRRRGAAPRSRCRRPTSVHERTAEKLTSVPDGYRAPSVARRVRARDAFAPPRRRAPLLQRRRVHRVGVRAAGRARLGRAARRWHRLAARRHAARARYREASGDVAVLGTQRPRVHVRHRRAERRVRTTWSARWRPTAGARPRPSSTSCSAPSAGADPPPDATNRRRSSGSCPG